MESFEILKNSRYLKYVKNSELSELLKGGEKISFAQNEIFIRPGDQCQYVYLIIDGVLRNFVTNENGREYTKIFRGAGEVMAPYSELIQNIESRYFFQSITKSTVYRIQYAKIINLADSSHVFERLLRIIAEENFIEKEDREFELLKLSTQQRYEIFKLRFNHLLDFISQRLIATYLGVTPEALNRILSTK